MTPPNPGYRDPLPVGVMIRSYVDPARQSWDGRGPRPLRTRIWYPALPGAPTYLCDEPDQFAAPVALAPAAGMSRRSSQYPLVLLSHGANGSAQSMMWLGHRLAAAGYLAAAVDHLGPDNCEQQLAGIFYLSDWHLWERPRDLSVVLDRLLDDELLGPRIDRQRLGAAGFSAGGASVISLAGGRLDLQQLQAGSKPPKPLRAAVTRAITEWQRLQTANPAVQESLQRTDCPCQDDRVRCVFALAPALGAGFPCAALSAVTIPVCLVAGRGDTVTPLTANAQHFADHIKGAELRVLPGETGHWSSDPGAAERARELKQVSKIARRFFARHLPG